MKTDVKSNFTFTPHAAPVAAAAATYTGTAVDLSLGESVSFHINAGTVASGGTLDAKLQHSPDNSTWTDEVAGAGNSTSITQITASGAALLHVVNPRARYYRVSSTVAVAAVTYGITAVLGPLKSVDAG